MHGKYGSPALLSIGLFGTVALLDVYLLFYLKVFTGKFDLPLSYLSIVQVLFLVWNAVNDPLMGFIQDIGFCGIEWVKDRRKVILYAGPVFSACFLMFWFPWSINDGLITAIQLMVSLFIFDTLLTLVLSAYCGLCVEYSTKHSDRVRIIVFGEIVGVFAGILVFPIEKYTHGLDYFGYFQLICVGISIVSAAGMVFSAICLKSFKPADDAEVASLQEHQELSGGFKKICKISWQIIKEVRFIALVGAQFFKILRFMGNEQFLLVFTEQLLVKQGFFEQGSSLLGIFYVFARTLGSILFLSLWQPVNKLGCQFVLQAINVLSLINCLAMYFIGSDSYLWIAIFIIVENCLARCGWQGYYMVIAGEVIDTDKDRHKRKSPLSTTIFTLKALFTKPADQLAPLILTAVLEMGKYTQFNKQCDVNFVSNNGTMFTDAIGLTSDVILDDNCKVLNDHIFAAVVWFPFMCAVGESLFLALDQWATRNTKKTHPTVIAIDMKE